MSETKVSLTIALRGGVMLSKQECLKQLTEPVLVKKGPNKGKPMKDKEGNILYTTRTVVDPEKTEHYEIKLTDKNNKVTEILGFNTRGFRPAKQVLNISKEAYEYFVSNEVPEGYRAPADFKPSKSALKKGISKTKQAWMLLTPKYKLEWHLHRICASRQGTLVDYKVFTD